MNKIDLKNIEIKEIVPGYFVRFVHSENMTFAFWEIKAGASLPEHSHPHEQLSNVTEGKFRLCVDGKSEILEPNSVVIIPGNTKHSGTAITYCKITDVFYPVREDYLQKS